MAPIRATKKEDVDEKPYQIKPSSPGTQQSGWKPELDTLLLETVDKIIHEKIYEAVKDHPLVREKCNGSRAASTDVRRRVFRLLKQRNQ